MQLFVSLLEKYGLFAIFLNVVAEGIGLPLPSYPILMVASALAVNMGQPVHPILLVGIAGVMAADMTWFLSGRRYGTRVIGLLCRISLSPDFCVRKTYALFKRVGPASLCFTNFVPGFSNIAVVLAGSTGVPFHTFLFFNVIGAVIYMGVGVMLGTVFHDAIGDAVDMLAELGHWGLLMVAALVALYLFAKWVQFYLFVRQLRMDRISVNELRQLIDDGTNPVILDVRPLESRQRDGFIPGSIPTDIFEIERSAGDMAVEREVIIYCACPNETSAALVAKHLRAIAAARRLQKAGVRIRPLMGGFDAWVEAGHILERAEAEKTAIAA